MSRNKTQKQEQSGVQINYSAQRVGIFIDVQNMYYSAKNLFGAKANFINIVKGAIRDRNLVRAIAYVVETPQQHEVRFLDALRLQGIELKERDLQVFSSGVKKADWDVGITVDAIRMSDKLDVIVLVSGDGDYIPLVEYLQGKGVKVEVMAFRSTSSSRLVEAVDQFIDLAEHVSQYLIIPGNGNHHHAQQQHVEESARVEDADPVMQGPMEFLSPVVSEVDEVGHSPLPQQRQPQPQQKKNSGGPRRMKRTIM